MVALPLFRQAGPPAEGLHHMMVLIAGELLCADTYLSGRSVDVSYSSQIDTLFSSLGRVPTVLKERGV